MPNINNIEFIKRQTLIAIFSDERIFRTLVLKGGTALELAYEVSARASKDLDFSISSDFDDYNAIGNTIKFALDRHFATMGIVIYDFHIVPKPNNLPDSLKGFWGGYSVDFKLINQDNYNKFHANIEDMRRNSIPVAINRSTKFEIDISKHEYCGVISNFQIDGVIIPTYAPELIVIEKVRALCQQMPVYQTANKLPNKQTPRAKDYYDIFVLTKRFNIDIDSPSFQESLQRSFVAKKVAISLIGDICKFHDLHEASFISVLSTLPSNELHVEDFSFYADYLDCICDKLKPLWDIKMKS